MKGYIGLFLLSALLSYLLTPVVKVLGQRLQAYGKGLADGRRTPGIPRLGGLAIAGALLAAWMIARLISPAVEESFKTGWLLLIQLAVPAGGVLALGVFDDLAGATPFQKFSVEIVAASVVWCAGIRITAAPIFGTVIHSLGVSFFITVLWIVAVCNAFNMMDGLDGLATGVACIIAASLFVVAIAEGSLLIGALTVTLCGALAGFLRFNFAPARIYLGDTGSLFLGFFLAALAVLAAQCRPAPFTASVPFVVFALPLLEISATVVRRLLTRRPLFAGDRNHFHHRLLAKRPSPRRAALMLYAMAGFLSLGSLIVFRTTGSRVLLVIFAAGSAVWLLASYFQYEEFSGLIPLLPPGLLSGNHPAKKRAQNYSLVGQPEKAGPLEVKHEASFPGP
ncbi:MAG: MraY family glycosyltransferase [Terriglobia bacterium]